MTRARLLAWALAAGAAVEVGAEGAIRARVPSDQDWARAAAFVRRARQADDGVVVAPAWAGPIARLHLGDLVPVREAAHPDRARQGRIWELSIRGARHPEATGRVADQRRFGRVTVRRIERPAAEVVHDFTARAAEAGVGAVPRVAEIDFTPRWCLPASPPRTLRFADAELGRSLAIHGGIHDFQSRYHSNAPVTLLVRVAGAEVARLVHRQERGWQGWTVDTSAHAGRRAAVEFEVRADRPAHRTFCFHAEARR